MSELYALSVVDEIGFLKGCTAVSPSLCDSLSQISRDSIAVISCSRVIAHLWSNSTDGDSFLPLSSSVIHIQRLARSNFRQVERLCAMDDVDFLALENFSTSKARKAELGKDYRDLLTAIKYIDKLNVHRFVESVRSTLPMIGHASQIGELVMEKTHQILNRAIQQSNNNEVQVHSVQSPIFNDWKGRLALQIAASLEGDDNALRGCFRLLPTVKHFLEVAITPQMMEAVRTALRPDWCIPALLSAQAKSVLCPRGSCAGSISWVSEKKTEQATQNVSLSTQKRADTYSAFPS